jgi:hypothetical protein
MRALIKFKKNNKAVTVQKVKKVRTSKRIKPLRRTLQMGEKLQISNSKNNQDDNVLPIDDLASNSCSSTYDSSADEFVPCDLEDEDDSSTFDGEEETLDDIKIQSSESFRYQQCFNNNIQEEIVIAINELGFAEHFTTDLGGANSPQYIITWGRRLSRFLNFTYYSIHNTFLQGRMVIDWIKAIIDCHCKNIFPKYIAHLRDRLELKPNTILVELYDIKKFMDWFIYMRTPKKDESQSGGLDCLKPLDYVLANICKSERKRLKRQNSENQDLETLIENRQLPVGGLQELQQCLQKDLGWIKSWATELTENGDVNYVGKTEYNRFMQVLYAAMYVYSPQGRISGIESITLKQADEMLQNGVTFSTKFKTNSTFGYQPVTTSKLTRKLLHIYVTYLRPGTNVGGEHALFLNYNGTRATRIGDKVRYTFIMTRRLIILLFVDTSLLQIQSPTSPYYH